MFSAIEIIASVLGFFLILSTIEKVMTVIVGEKEAVVCGIWCKRKFGDVLWAPVMFKKMQLYRGRWVVPQIPWER